MNTNDNCTRNRMNPIALWRRIRQPRNKRVLLTIVYVMALTAGLSAIVNPPSSISGEIGPYLTYSWGGLLIICGIAGAPSVIPGAWFWERLALKLGALATVIYGFVVVVLHVTSEAGNRIPQACMIAIACLFMLVRWLEIRGEDTEPRTSGGTPVRDLLPAANVNL